MRLKLLKWIDKTFFHTPEGESPCKSIIFLYSLLFPLRYLYEKQSGLRYDAIRNLYIIGGVNYSGEVFDFFSDKRNIGKKFEFDITTDDLNKVKYIKIKRL